MAQNSHVPKFGNWDSDNVPYTKYFENARKEKSSPGAKMFNPNDPEQNPEAFMDVNSNHGTLKSPFHVHPSWITTDRDIPVSKFQHKNQSSSEDGESQGFMESPIHHNAALPKANLEVNGRRNYKHSSSEASSEQSSFHDNSQNSHHHQYPMGTGNKAGMSPGSWTRKNSSDSSHSICPSTPGRPKSKGVNSQLDDNPRRAAAVPKFGAWDERDPASGDGFTIIFNKVKEEKKIGASKFPTIPTEPIVFSNSNKSPNSSSRGRSICCCLFPGADQ